ncbi:hypothetical protein ACFQ1I_33705 [Kitasatospora arboriphila]
MPLSYDTAPTGPDDRGDADAAVVDLLVRTYPPELVDAAIAACGRTERRRRLLLPAGWSTSSSRWPPSRPRPTWT